jgi:hypothetical protein
MLPITAELHIQDLDVLNFVCFWDPRSYNGLTPASIGNAVFKIRITCNHAQEKKNFLEKFQSVKQFLPYEPNTFAT